MAEVTNGRGLCWLDKSSELSQIDEIRLNGLAIIQFVVTAGRCHEKLPLPTDRYVGNRVRMRRLMLGLSQTELATAVGVTFQQVQKYEKGKNRISASRLQQSSKVLNVPIPFFFEHQRKNGKTSEVVVGAPNQIDALLATRSGLALVRAFTQIKNSKLRRTIFSMVEEVAGRGD